MKRLRLRSLISDSCFIDIVLRKQRAEVIKQWYIYIPINNKSLKLTRPLIGRRADEKEVVKWYPRKEHVKGLLKAFLIASES